MSFRNSIGATALAAAALLMTIGAAAKWIDEDGVSPMTRSWLRRAA